MNLLARLLGARVHYAWVALGLTFLTLLCAAAVRASPAVLIVPLEQAFGWSPASIAAAISLNLVLYGFTGPFAAALMQRIGVRRTLMSGLAVVLTGMLLSTLMTRPWHLVLFWGLLVGIGAGAVAPVLGATIVNRWFTARRGLAMGVVTAASAAGQLIFLPVLARAAEREGWRAAIYVVAGVIAVLIAVVALLLPERPESLQLRPFGERGTPSGSAPAPANPLLVAAEVLGRCVKSGDFWILFCAFFTCGASANGLVGTHLVAFCFDNGIPEVQAAWLLAAMGAFNIVGATLSGWLSDRYDPRVLLMCFFGLRGLSLLYLPYSHFDFSTLSVFALFYGLDWIATVPPIMRLITNRFGKVDAPVVFGWVFVAHQFGAGSIASLAGVLRVALGSYMVPFMLSGALCVAAAILVLRTGAGARPLAAQGAAD